MTSRIMTNLRAVAFKREALRAEIWPQRETAAKSRPGLQKCHQDALKNVVAFVLTEWRALLNRYGRL